MTTTTTEQLLKKLSEGDLNPLEELEHIPEKHLSPFPTWAIALSSMALGLTLGFAIWGLNW